MLPSQHPLINPLLTSESTTNPFYATTALSAHQDRIPSNTTDETNSSDSTVASDTWIEILFKQLIEVVGKKPNDDNDNAHQLMFDPKTGKTQWILSSNIPEDTQLKEHKKLLQLYDTLDIAKQNSTSSAVTEKSVKETFIDPISLESITCPYVINCDNKTMLQAKTMESNYVYWLDLETIKQSTNHVHPDIPSLTIQGRYLINELAIENNKDNQENPDNVTGSSMCLSYRKNACCMALICWANCVAIGPISCAITHFLCNVPVDPWCISSIAVHTGNAGWDPCLTFWASTMFTVGCPLGLSCACCYASSDKNTYSAPKSSNNSKYLLDRSGHELLKKIKQTPQLAHLLNPINDEMQANYKSNPHQMTR